MGEEIKMLTVSYLSSVDLEQLASLYEELTGTKTNMILMKKQFEKIINNPDYILIGVKDEEERLVGSVETHRDVPLLSTSCYHTTRYSGGSLNLPNG
jgi:hypothetical protein